MQEQKTDSRKLNREEQNPLISVIVPVYNIEQYLNRCIASIRQQTYRNLELILVDDGSTDTSGKICDAAAKEDKRIKVYHKENGGSSSARNLGLQHAEGEYIGFVDSDDYIDENMYEELVQAIFQFQVPMSQISRDEVSEDGTKREDVCVPPKEPLLISNHDMMEQLLLHKGDCSFCTRLTHRKFFENRKFPEQKLNEDFFLLVNMLTEIEKFVILPAQAYHVFYRLGSNTRKKDKNEFSRVYTDIVDHADWVTELTDSHYPDLKKVAERFGLYQRLDYMLHIPVSMMNGENEFYRKVVSHLRKHFFQMLKNPYLTGKNKLYLFLLTIAPKTVRKLHARIRKIN